MAISAAVASSDHDERPAPGHIAPASRPPPSSLRSEREEIMQRVATFRAHQGKLIKEREAYYLEMQARIRTVIGNDAGPDGL